MTNDRVFDDRYLVKSLIGAGRTSRVYHAVHQMSPASEVALKVLTPELAAGGAAERLRREALAMVSSRHANVIRLDDFHSVGSLCYLSMEYAPMGDLFAYTSRSGGRLPWARAREFLSQACAGLAFVHRAGILHGDVRPDNILVVSGARVALCDFGMSQLPGEGWAAAPDWVGQLGWSPYAAPECAAGTTIDQRSDVYALAATFFETLGGRLPSAADAGRESELLREAAPDVPPEAVGALTTAMSPDPGRRPASAAELLKMLGRGDRG
jgi:serine/threonine-protein kinase